MAADKRYYLCIQHENKLVVTSTGEPPSSPPQINGELVDGVLIDRRTARVVEVYRAALRDWPKKT